MLMRKSLRLFALAGAGTGLLVAACQPQTKPATATNAPAVVATAPAATPATPPASSGSPAASTPVTPPLADVPAYLAAHNLAPLWQADFNQVDNGNRPNILDGFYGAEHRHISVIFERVEQNPARPGVYRVQGRTRFRKNITPFDGTITVEGIKPLRAFLDLDSAEQAKARVYTATARFVLREDSTAAGAGTYRGTALMDFYQLPSGKLDLVREMPDSDLPTGGGGLLFRGKWQSFRSGREQEVAFATYTQAVLPDALADLYIGERGETLNPKYARLDWSEAWENDEWWAKSPKPGLSL
jgi:hypothetical protein